MRIEAAVEQFLQYLTLERGCTSATISAYASDIGQLVAHLESTGKRPRYTECDGNAIGGSRGSGRRRPLVVVRTGRCAMTP